MTAQVGLVVLVLGWEGAVKLEWLMHRAGEEGKKERESVRLCHPSIEDSPLSLPVILNISPRVIVIVSTGIVVSET